MKIIQKKVPSFSVSRSFKLNHPTTTNQQSESKTGKKFGNCPPKSVLSMIAVNSKAIANIFNVNCSQP